MKKNIVLWLIFYPFIINAGVSIDTIIETPEGPKQISDLNVGDKVVCFDKNLSSSAKPIVAIEEQEAELVVEIVTEDDAVIRVSPDQRVFVPYKWIQVEQLSLGDLLLKKDQTFTQIKGIHRVQERTELRFITVDEHKNFFVSKSSILIHNGVVGAEIGFWTGKFLVHLAGHGAMLAVAALTGPAAPATFAALEGTFAVPLEAASNMGALVGGLAGAVATGLI